jgi:hypothetical protein
MKEDCKKDMEERYAKGQVLLDNTKKALPDLKTCLLKVEKSEEDGIYRFYHRSFKVYWFQELVKEIILIFIKINPNDIEKVEDIFDKLFLEIILRGAYGEEWKLDHNSEWGKYTRPIVEAFFHVKYFLEMMIKYGEKLEEAPNLLPSGWAALLELYGIR